MPPTRPSPAQAAPSLWLPPEVLLHILAAVPQADRMSSVALVCKQLQAFSTAPPLLRELDVRISGDAVVPRTEALLRLLVRAGEHVRSLRLDIRVPEPDSADDYEVAALVASCLGACAAWQAQPDGGLRELHISAATPLLNTSCLPLLSDLEQLHLPGRPSSLRVRLGSSWRQLTALQTAQLSGCLLCDKGEGPGLPPSLTRLCIEGDFDLDIDEEGEPQLRTLDEGVLAGLPVLQSLVLYSCGCSRSSLAAVSGLTALSRLALHTLSALPPPDALAALAPSLRALEVHSAISDLGAYALGVALTALTALELLELDLEAVDDVAPDMPAAIALVPRLSHVALSFYTDEPGACQGTWHNEPSPALPWDSLRWLAVPLEAAFRLAFRLDMAEQLETLCLLLPGAGEPLEASLRLEAWLATDAWSSLWRFVATHPPLRCLLYEVPANSAPFSYQLLDALLELKEQRPALEVRRLAAPEDRFMHPPACWREMDLDLLF